MKKTFLKSAALTIAAIFFCASSGCASPATMRESLVVPEQTFLTITKGTTLDAVKTKLGLAARHEFTIAGADGTYTLLGCFVVPPNGRANSGSTLFLLFRDKVLSKIIEPVQFPHDVVTEEYNGHTVRVSRARGWGIEDTTLVTKTINSPALTRDQIIDRLKPYSGSGMEPMNILPAAVIVAPLAVVLLPATITLAEKEYAMNQDLLKRYDGCLAKLDMSAEEVEALYGKPQQILSAKNEIMAKIYEISEKSPLVDQSGKFPHVDDEVEFNNMAVVFNEEGHVIAIYSNTFFCDVWRKGNLTPASSEVSKK